MTKNMFWGAMDALELDGCAIPTDDSLAIKITLPQYIDERAFAPRKDINLLIEDIHDNELPTKDHHVIIFQFYVPDHQMEALLGGYNCTVYATEFLMLKEKTKSKMINIARQ